MKLTDQQKHHVYRYLERQKLKTQEFFDESFDHLICHLENQISNGESFLESLEKYDKSLKKEKYTYGFFVVSTGWKAIEYQFTNSKKECFKEIQQSFFKAQIFTYRSLIWIFLATIYWYLVKNDYRIIQIFFFTSLIITGIIVPFFDKEFRQDAFKWPKPIKNYQKWIVAWEYKAGLSLLILPYFAGKLIINHTYTKFDIISELLKFAIIFYVLLNQASKLEMFYRLKSRKSTMKQHM